MKKTLKTVIFAFVVAAAVAVSLLAGCGATYVTGVERTADGNIRVNYSDGGSEILPDGGGAADEITVADMYDKYVKEYGETSYADFLKLYLNKNSDYSQAVSAALRSSAKVYTEFVETAKVIGWGGVSSVSDLAVKAGSAVIWHMDSSDGGYTYFVTNYHVMYDAKADSVKNEGYIARRTVVYLYGSESEPEKLSAKDENGYSVYDYGPYAIECEYVGGTVASDIAVVRAKTEKVKKINPDMTGITLADGYTVGQTAIAVGNAEAEGISATQGIISVASENIALNIDGTERLYRSIRIDTALYSGNSGGGLFDGDGRLIGITNSGNRTDQNINYAIPLEIVKGTVENILYYFSDSGETAAGAYTLNLGIDTETENSRYVFDLSSGYGGICEDVKVVTCEQGSVAEKLGLKQGDILKTFTVNGNDTKIKCAYNISDLLLTVRENDAVSFTVSRNGAETVAKTYKVQKSDLIPL